MKFEILYFGSFTRPTGKKGRFADVVEAESVEHAALVFNRKHFRFFKGMGIAEFRKLRPHFKYWGLTINGEDYGNLTLAAHFSEIERMKSQMENWRKFLGEEKG